MVYQDTGLDHSVSRLPVAGRSLAHWQGMNLADVSHETRFSCAP
jgi:hypothetical protein